jgi:drug/metabolite transporter (DMT)-like permease
MIARHWRGWTKPETLASFAAALVGVQVGAAIVASRFVIEQTQPASLALLRYSVGALCLLPFVLASKRVRFVRRDLLPIALLGMVQFGVVITLTNYALQFIPSASVALIFATLPLQTMLIAALLRQESLTRFKTLGVVLTILGVGLALGEDALRHSARDFTTELLVLFSALAAAICTVLYRPYLKQYPALQVSGLGMVAWVVFLALLAVREDFFLSLPSFSPTGWIAVIFIGVSSGLGYYLWLWALNHATPTKVTIFLALNPITATGLGALLLGERPNFMFVLGVTCVVVGLAVAHVKGSMVRTS